MCESTQGTLCPSPMKIHQSMWIQWPFLQKKKNFNQRSLVPLEEFWPHICWGLMCDSTHRIILSKSHENTSKYVDTVTFFGGINLNQRSLTPRWPLTPHLLRSHGVTLPKDHFVQVPWKYIKVFWYCAPISGKTWTKVHWPLDDLWPHHLLRSHGWLCPRIIVSKSMGICQCMWIQLSNLQKLLHTYIHILSTFYVHDYILHTTYRISDHIVSFWTTFRGGGTRVYTDWAKHILWVQRVILAAWHHVMFTDRSPFFGKTGQKP